MPVARRENTRLITPEMRKKLSAVKRSMTNLLLTTKYDILTMEKKGALSEAIIGIL